MRSKVVRIFSFLLITIVSFLAIGFIKVYANGDISLDINSKYLYNETNTFEYKYENTSETDFNNETRYYVDRNKRNKEEVSKDAQITVFTHGWRGYWDSWGHEEDSLVTILKNETNANVYKLDFDSNESSSVFNIYKYNHA